ncbi:MAG: putative oxidoreductase [Candidatus Omnitrophica bacterium ADurb.Bin277]|mgnify:CR=1 FL=1|nr:MAG: putative oxidoreductase [Candidatus Omnitrophica bacterium ADurb.Bin277]
MIRSFKGLNVLVTGASSGIGEAMADEFAGRGANLVLVSRDLAKLRQKAEDLKTRYNVQARVIAADLTREDDREKIFGFVRRENVLIDILVNNAGVGHYGTFEEHSPGDIETMLKLNVEALVALTRFFLPGMQARKRGGILNVASIAGFQAVPYLPVYAATKAFVINFTEALWMENLGKGVRVFCLCPGNTMTRFHPTAGIGKDKMFFSVPAPKVARFALKIFLKGRRPVGIFGFWNKVIIYAERLSPRFFLAFLTRLIYKS